VAYWEALKHNPISADCYRGLAICSTHNSASENWILLTSAYNYIAYSLNPERYVSLLKENAILYKLAGKIYGAKFWYDKWAMKKGKEIIPIEELCWYKLLREYDEMYDDEGVSNIMFKLHKKYPKHFMLYYMLKNEMKKKIKGRVPSWTNTPEIDAEYRNAVKYMRNWVIPESTTYLYDLQADDVV